MSSGRNSSTVGRSESEVSIAKTVCIAIIVIAVTLTARRGAFAAASYNKIINIGVCMDIKSHAIILFVLLDVLGIDGNNHQIYVLSRSYLIAFVLADMPIYDLKCNAENIRTFIKMIR